MSIRTEFDDIELIKTIGSKHCLEILAETDMGLSAEEIGERADVPIASVYRRLDMLRKAGFLDLEEHAPSESTRKRIYRRAVTDIRIVFDGERLHLDVTVRRKLPDKLDNLWSELSMG